MSTQENNQKLDDFILKATKENLVFPVLSNTPAISKLTVQQLIHDTNITTLTTFGTKLETLEKTSDNSRFSKIRKCYVGTVTASELADMIEIIIVMRQEAKEKEVKSVRIKELKIELENMKTPEEKRAEMQRELNNLTS